MAIMNEQSQIVCGGACRLPPGALSCFRSAGVVRFLLFDHGLHKAAVLGCAAGPLRVSLARVCEPAHCVFRRRDVAG